MFAQVDKEDEVIDKGGGEDGFLARILYDNRALLPPPGNIQGAVIVQGVLQVNKVGHALDQHIVVRPRVLGCITHALLHCHKVLHVWPSRG